jgi:hypothetical protein
MSRGVRVFLVRLGVEAVRLHRPTILRMRADTTPPGMPCTSPLRISTKRRATVELHAGLTGR